MHHLGLFVCASLLLAPLSAATAAPVGLGAALLERSELSAVLTSDEVSLDAELAPDALLSDEVTERLLALERRLDAAALSPEERARIMDEIARRRASVRNSTWAAEATQADPLANALRSLVPISRSDRPQQGRSAEAPVRRSVPLEGFQDGGAAALGSLDEEVSAELRGRLLAVREGLATFVDMVVAPELDGQGRPGFSVLGLSGFRLESSSGQRSLAFRDVNFSSSPLHQGGNAFGSTSAQYDPARGQAHPAAEAERLAIYRLMFLVWDVATHPITLGLLLVAALFRGVANMASRHHAH